MHSCLRLARCGDAKSRVWHCSCKARLANCVVSFPAGVRVAEVMLGAGALPALEQLFRQLPVVSPAHVTAATFLVSCEGPLLLTAH